MLKTRHFLAATILVTASLALAQSTVRVAVPTLPSSFDPVGTASNEAMRIRDNVYETLFWHVPGSGLEPRLATSWEQVSDTEVDVHIRPDVRWHNGEKLDVADVVYSFERILDPESIFTTPRTIIETVKSVEAIDDSTVRFTTFEPDPVLIERISSRMWIVNQDYLQEVGYDGNANAGIGTGPFRIIEQSGEAYRLEAFPDYWGDQPNVNTVEYLLMPELAGRITALVNGEVHIAASIPPDMFGMLGSYDNVSITGNVMERVIHVLIYSAQDPAMEDVRLRQALNLGIDRQLLSDILWGGQAEVPLSNQYKMYGDFYFEDWPEPAYDPELARQLVEESNYAGETLVFATHPTYYTLALDAAQIMVEMWREIGINVELAVVENVAATPHAIRTWSNGPRFAEPSGGIWLLWGPNSARQTIPDWPDTPERARFNELGTAVVTEMDSEVRTEMYREMLAIYDQQAPGTVLYMPYEAYGVSNSINWEPSDTYYMGFHATDFSFKD